MANIIASGDWWTLDDDGLLRVFCVGDMPLSGGDMPWVGYAAQITAIEIADSVTDVAESAFDCDCGDYSNLASASIGANVVTIRAYAFYNCAGLASVTIGDSVASIECQSFYRCSGLTSVTIPDSVTSIGEGAFEDCANLTSVTIPNGVTTIWDSSFYSCRNLASVTIPDGVTSIEFSAFCECVALTSVTIPNSVTSIGDSAFQLCVGLTSVAIGSGMTYIGDSAFFECDSLSDVYYAGTQAQWSEIEFDDYNDNLTSANIHYNYSPEPPLTLTEALYIGGALSENKISGYLYAVNLMKTDDVSYAQSISVDGNEMRSDELYITVHVADNPDSFPDTLSGVTQATPVWYDRTDNAGNRRLEKYYWKAMERVSRYDYAITAQSPIGRLTPDYPGGLYDGQPLPELIADVLGGIVPHSVDSLLSSVRVYGWLPYTTRREALHALALAYGFVVRRDENRNLFFTLLPSASVALPDTVIFNGGSVDYRTGKTYARIDVTSYAYLKTANDKTVTLFDNTAEAEPVDRLTVKFSNAPCYDISATSGLTIHSVGVNHAIVSGVGVLSGRPYNVTSSVFSLDGDPNADPNAVLSLSDAYLITAVNAETVAEKLRASYNAPAVVSMDFIRRTESPGDLFAFVDPYGTARTGYLTELSGKVTSFDRAAAVFLCGYDSPWGNAYDDVLTLSGSGAWTVPDFLDGSSVRIVLIGGGQGGASGQHGTDAAAVGCGRGLPGKGGKVLSVRIAVAAGQTYSYQCGAPGSGGSPTDETSDDMPDNMTVYITPTGDHYHLNPNCNGGEYSPVTLKEAVERGFTPCSTCVQEDGPYYLTSPGANGGNTTFGAYSSANGKIIALGYHDIIYGVQYAVSGPDNGVEGGAATSGQENGSRESPAWENVERHAVSPAWDSSQSWMSGNPGAGNHYKETNPSGTFYEWAYGGLGGGAAVGANGPDGQDAPQSFRGGDGANGASASALFPPDSRSYGSGGSGGHGGGEGAPGGSGNASDAGATTIDGQSGAGGAASSGQNGAPGCVLIYFKKPVEYLYHFGIDANNHLILTYYTHEPPPYSVDNGHLLYAVPDGQTPPALEIQGRNLYLTE